MKEVAASVRFVIGDVVTWFSESGRKHTGTVVSIKEGDKGDLITARLADGQYRSFYDGATDWVMWDK